MRSIDQIVSDQREALGIAGKCGASKELLADYERRLRLSEKARARLHKGWPWAARVIENAAEEYARCNR